MERDQDEVLSAMRAILAASPTPSSSNSMGNRLSLGVAKSADSIGSVDARSRPEAPITSPKASPATPPARKPPSARVNVART
jgi:hypothetical protein